MLYSDSGVRCYDHIRNEDIRNRNGVDVFEEIDENSFAKIGKDQKAGGLLRSMVI